ncbi:MAG: helix-turn-helix transcriptional regulator [Sedimentisphaerales bacterium]|nr:helix-turn-helix transcriptional regulator [Sedimentisphaerales bacterium]
MRKNYDFGVLRSLRRRNKLTLEELAKISGLTYPTVASIENNKTSPSLSTLDALASALDTSVGSLVGLAENQAVLTRQTKTIKAETLQKSELGLENLWIANFDKCKIFRATAKAKNAIKSMELHENCDCHEICYILRGSLEIKVKNNIYKLNPNDVILFDGTIEHDYTIISDSEFLVIHIPKDIRIIDALLKSKYIIPQEQL